MPLTAATVHFNGAVEGTGWKDLIDAPDPGTSILIYRAQLLNGAWGNNWVIFQCIHTVTGEVFDWFSAATMGALTSAWVPYRNNEGPIVMESGWKLRVYSSAIIVGGLNVEINYGIDTGYGSQPSDYHSAMTQLDPGAGITVLPVVAAAPDYKVRHVRSMCLTNYDTVTHGIWGTMRDAGGANAALLWNLGNVVAQGRVYAPYHNEGLTLDSTNEIAINKSVNDVTNPSKVWCSWLEAGGYPTIGPSDEGPWTASQQIIQRRSIHLDGAQDRLMTYPTPAGGAAIGIADEWTMVVWSKKQGAWSSNTEWLFMLGGLSNAGAIHLSRNTDPAVGGNPYEIEIHEGAVTKKKWRWYGGAIGGYWECAGVTFDGSQAQANKLNVFMNGGWYIWPGLPSPTKVIDEDIGTLVDEDRYLGLGGAPAASGTNNDGFGGRIWMGAVWSTALSPATMAQLGDPTHSHHDLRTYHGAYTPAEAATLEHYYRPGLRYSPNIGKDWGVGGNLTDLQYENHVADVDLVDDFPAKGLI